MIYGVIFSPQALTESEQKAIVGGVIHKKLDKGEAAMRLGGKFLTSIARQFWRDGGK